MDEDGKKWWHVRWISGFFEAVARLVIVGAKTPNQKVWDEGDNPDGWRESQLATCGWVDDRMELLAIELRKVEAASLETNRLLTNLLVGLRASGMANESLDDLPPTLDSLGSV